MKGGTGLGLRLVGAVAGCWLVGAIGAQAASRATAAAGYWTNTATWVGGALPEAGDDVAVTNVVTLDVSPPALSSFSNAATLTFAGWNTALTATVVTVNGTITHLAQSDTNGSPGVYGDWTPDNRVWIVCSNLTVAAGKTIDASGKGYAAGAFNHDGYGPGAGSWNSTSFGKGASYGGGQRLYGAHTEPTDPGSGGGVNNNVPGGAGGGAIRIEASGGVTVNGTIAANGISVSQYAGAGSGGSVFITCGTITGAGGAVNAIGGSGIGGSGGRIAIVYTNGSDQAGLDPTITASAAGGSGAELGTVYLPDTIFLKETMTHSGQIYMEGLTSWSPNRFVLSNGWLRFQPPGFPLSVTNDVLIYGSGARLETSALSVGSNITVRYGRLDVRPDAAVTNPAVNCGGDLLLTNNGALVAYSGPTNSLWPYYGALVAVTGNVTIFPGSWVYPYINSSTGNGGGALFRMNHLRIASGGGFNADALGWAGTPYAPGYGYGRGPTTGAGAGYGGIGGSGDPGAGGTNYGTAHGPMYPGSGGAGDGGNMGGNGGGLIHIRALGSVTLDGALTADGTAGGLWGAGGGSGGGIFVLARTFAGVASGSVSADGQNGGSNQGGGGGGGGGRIAIWVDTDEQRLDDYLVRGKRMPVVEESATNAAFAGTLSVTNGVTFRPAQPGTMWFLRIPPLPGTMFLVQ